MDIVKIIKHSVIFGVIVTAIERLVNYFVNTDNYQLILLLIITFLSLSIIKFFKKDFLL